MRRPRSGEELGAVEHRLQHWLPIAPQVQVSGTVVVVPDRSLVASRLREFAVWVLSAVPLILMLAQQTERSVLAAIVGLSVAGFLAYFFYNQRQATEVVLQPGRTLLLRGGTRRSLYVALIGRDSPRRFTDATGFLFVFADETQGLLVDLSERDPSRWTLKPLPSNAELHLKSTASGRIVSAIVRIDGTDHRLGRARGRLRPRPTKQGPRTGR